MPPPKLVKKQQDTVAPQKKKKKDNKKEQEEQAPPQQPSVSNPAQKKQKTTKNSGSKSTFNADQQGSKDGQQMGLGSNIYQTRAIIDFDPTPYKLELGEPTQLNSEQPIEEQLPDLKVYDEQRKALTKWDKERDLQINTGIKESTLPAYAKKVAAEKRAEQGLVAEEEAPPPSNQVWHAFCTLFLL